MHIESNQTNDTTQWNRENLHVCLFIQDVVWYHDSMNTENRKPNKITSECHFHLDWNFIPQKKRKLDNTSYYWAFMYFSSKYNTIWTEIENAKRQAMPSLVCWNLVSAPFHFWFQVFWSILMALHAIILHIYITVSGNSEWEKQ